MGQRHFSFLVLGLALGLVDLARAQEDFRFTSAQRLTNRELLLKFTAPAGPSYRIDAAESLGTTAAVPWFPLLSLRGSNVNLQHLDSGAPFVTQRFYRAEQLTTGTNVLTGDHLPTSEGDLIIHPLYHASFVMSWNGKIIYSDPDDDPAYEPRYAGLPKADLILVTHEHGDHYSSGKIGALKTSNTVIVVPQAVYNRTDFAVHRPNAIALAYGVSTNIMGLTVQAVPGYNQNHSFGINNCYVLTMGGKRIFISGDTGDVQEIESLTDIDVAFLCMNLPFTMNASSGTNVIRRMRPKVVYPYHYREGSGGNRVYTNAPIFKEWLGLDPGVEVRLRPWY